MTPKIPLQTLAGFKEFQTKDLIPNEPQYPRGGMKERRARCFALCGGSKACPDLFEGSFLDLFSIFYCFFIGLHGLSAEGRFGIGAFCFKTKDTSHSRGDEREKTNYHSYNNFLHFVQDDTCTIL